MSSAPSSPKPLLYSSISMLIESSKVDAKLFQAKCPDVCKRLLKLYDMGRQSALDGEKEKAFIMFMRFFEGYSRLRASKSDTSDQEYVSKIISQEKLKQAIETLEKLRESLQIAYERAAEAAAVAVVVTPPATLSAEVAAPTTTTAVASVEVPAFATSVTRVEPIKISNKGSRNSNALSAKELRDLVSNVSNRVLIVDTRPRVEFEASRLDLSLLLTDEHKKQLPLGVAYVNIPDTLIGTVSWQICEALQRQGSGVDKQCDQLNASRSVAEVFQARANFDYLVLLDADTRVDQLRADHAITRFKQAVFEYDVESVKLRHEPLVLDGGLAHWIDLYPALRAGSSRNNSRSGREVPLAAKKSNGVTLDFDYPEVISLVKPVESKGASKKGVVSADPVVLKTSTTAVPELQPKLQPQQFNNSSGNKVPVLSNVDAGLSRTNVSANPPSSEINTSSKTTPTVTTVPNINRSTKPTAASASASAQKSSDKDVTEQFKRLNIDGGEGDSKRPATTDLSATEDRSAKSNDRRVSFDKISQAENSEQSVGGKRDATQQSNVATMRDSAATPTAAAAAASVQQPIQRRQLPPLADVRLPQASLPRASLDTHIYNTVYAPSRNLSLQTAHMREEGTAKVLNTETGLFSYMTGGGAAAAATVYQPTAPSFRKQQLQNGLSEAGGGRGSFLTDADVTSTTKILSFKPPTSHASSSAYRPSSDSSNRGTIGSNGSIPAFDPPNRSLKSSLLTNNVSSKRNLSAASSSVNSNLKRTVSSPNIAKLDEQLVSDVWENNSRTDRDEPEESAVDPAVGFDRHTIPLYTGTDNAQSSNTQQQQQQQQPQQSSMLQRVATRPPTVNRRSKPMSEQTMRTRLNELQPVYGNAHAGLTGIRNLGNTCFMNSIIQCLMGAEQLVAFFLSGRFKDDLNRDNILGFGGEIADEFSVIVMAMWDNFCRVIAPRRFKQIIGNFNEQFVSNDQQDAQELLLSLLDGLHEDLNRVEVRKQILDVSDDESRPDYITAEQAWQNHLTNNDSIIVDLFQGQFKSTVTCLTCSRKSVRFDAFMYLTLNIPSTNSSIYDCLESFSKAEELAGDCQVDCSRCKLKRNATKKIEIWKLPPLLIIHFKRFKYTGRWRDKITSNIEYPAEELLHMDAYLRGVRGGSAPNGNDYRLFGVSNHTGTMDGGHYTAMCRHAKLNRWFKFDDTDVRECEASTVKNRNAYILFYARVPS